MSKLIKSKNAKQIDESRKEIKLRTISYVRKNQSSLTPDNNDSASDVHYLEQKITDANLEAEQILANAKNEVERWQEDLKQAEANMQVEAEQRFQEAEENGRRQGYEIGLQEAHQQYAEKIEKARSIVSKAKEDALNHIEHAEKIMLDLSIKVAQKIVGSTIQSNQESWLYVLKEAISEVRLQEEIRVYVHPERYEKTLQHKEELMQIATHTRQLYIYPREDLDEDGCLVETPFGLMEASIDNQLSQLKIGLLEKLKEGEGNRV
ncbi:flagellar assembly protein FliH [Evansella cellulosilytica]|uniref:Flagellar assembly protein FliH n=1 Tax=Evansella cellulosilytica (strain ATCC 21833 / DSM 2522 / FERM P-1141 / JCM 9156 / N-4) TaxID=649639 RepID=E6TSW6_EVAC2|nr:flagellar assembly protein FliH [Evansella cellulosilytica]ADU30758.1 flagellar assembly protein FliH/type III secretion system HrpE [Evansella cellulosilytica DSM 2522]